MVQPEGAGGVNQLPGGIGDFVLEDQVGGVVALGDGCEVLGRKRFVSLVDQLQRLVESGGELQGIIIKNIDQALPPDFQLAAELRDAFEVDHDGPLRVEAENLFLRRNDKDGVARRVGRIASPVAKGDV